MSDLESDEVMPATLAAGIGAAAALVPALAIAFFPRESRDRVFWIAVVVAVFGPGVWTWVQLAGAWNTGIAVALWLTVAVTMALFAGLAAVSAQGWRLITLLAPYVFILAVLAVLWQAAPEQPFVGSAPAGWIRVHIVVSVGAYALLTLASVAALAVFLLERALKQKRRGRLSAALPPVADSESLQQGLLWAAAVGLAIAVLSGMATEYFEVGRALVLNHKTVLSLLTLVVVVGLLAAHLRTGMRGRRAARLVLLAYLLLTLAYPGVKFVTDILLA